MGSKAKSQNSGWASRRQSRRHSMAKHPPPMPIARAGPTWPGNRELSATTVSSPPPRYVDDKAAGLMFTPVPKYTAIRSPPPTAGSDTISIRPPVPPKGSYYSPTTRWEPAGENDGVAPGFFVQKEWDVESGDAIEMDQRGVSEDTDRYLLRGKRKDQQGYGGR